MRRCVLHLNAIARHVAIPELDVAVVVGAQKPHRDADRTLLTARAMTRFEHRRRLKPRVVRTSMIGWVVVPVRECDGSDAGGQLVTHAGEISAICGERLDGSGSRASIRA